MDEIHTFNSGCRMAAVTCSGMTITVCVCAVFVFGVDDYQPPAMSRAYFRAEFEHSEGGRNHAAGCFFSSGVVFGHEVSLASRERCLSKMCYARMS